MTANMQELSYFSGQFAMQGRLSGGYRTSLSGSLARLIAVPVLILVACAIEPSASDMFAADPMVFDPARQTEMVQPENLG